MNKKEEARKYRFDFIKRNYSKEGQDLSIERFIERTNFAVDDYKDVLIGNYIFSKCMFTTTEFRNVMFVNCVFDECDLRNPTFVNYVAFDNCTFISCKVSDDIKNAAQANESNSINCI